VFYKDMMVVFGGIHEVTKELNDVVALDIAHRKWIVLFEETGSSSPARLQPINNASPESSPLPRFSVTGSTTVKRFDKWNTQTAAAGPGSSMKDFNNRPSTVLGFPQ
jgi:hypothetical protein